MSTIIALDPGVTTGVALFDTTCPSTPPRSWQIGPEDHHLTLWELFRRSAPDIIVYERFNYQRRDKVVLTSVEYIGLVKLWQQSRGIKIYLQTSSQAMNLWTDEKLKKLGLYKPAMPHAMDAVRHLLYYLVITANDQSWLQLLRPLGFV